MQSLEGVRVLEIGEGLSSALTGLHLALQGAQVLQWTGGLHRRLDKFEAAYFDRLRTAHPPNATFDRLLCEADIVVVDLPPARWSGFGIPGDEESLRAGQVLVAVTPMGIDGPHAAYSMDDITEWAAGGLAYVTRRVVPDDDDAGYTPLNSPGRQPEILGGLAGTIGALFGLRVAQQSHRGIVIDVSRQEVQAAMLHGVIPPYVWNNQVVGAPEARLSNIGMLLPAADGEIYIRTVEPHQWDSLVSWMGEPEWAKESWVADAEQRRANWDAVRALVGQWTAMHEREWLYREGQRHRVPVAMPRDVADVLEADQFDTRRFWRDIDVTGVEGKAPAVPLLDRDHGVTTAAVGSGATDHASAPPQRIGGDLSGVRVLDLGWSWAGPYAGMILADLGAEVLKLESLGRIDILRWSGAFADGIRHHERSGYYGACNRGKRSFQLNLKHPNAREIVLQLVEQSDVLIENFAPRVMESLGLGRDVLLERNPRLVALSMSGYGSSGPERDYVSYGDHLLHASGIASLTGEEDDPHTKIGIFYGDPVAGMYGALGILAGLHERDRIGRGAHLEFSQLEGLVSLIPGAVINQSVGLQPKRYGTRHPEFHPHGFYRCVGYDTWVAISVRSDGEWEQFRNLLLADGITSQGPHETTPERLQHRDAIDAAVSEWTATRSPWEATAACQGLGIAAYPVLSAPALLRSNHLQHRSFFTYLDRAIVGPGPVTGPVLRTPARRSQVRSPAPLLGEHNRYVYREILGMSPEQIEQATKEQLIH